MLKFLFGVALIGLCICAVLAVNYVQVAFVLAAADVTPAMITVWLAVAICAWSLVCRGVVSLFKK